MIVDSGTRWLPESLKPSAQSRSGCASLGMNGWPPAAILRSASRNGVLAPIKSRVVAHIKLLRNCGRDLQIAQENFTGASATLRGGVPGFAARDQIETSSAGYACNSLLAMHSCNPSVDRKSTRLNSSHLGISYAV